MNDDAPERLIIADLTVNELIPEDQMMYLFACKLAEAGIPIEPMTQELRYGVLEYEVKGNTVHFEWHGKDMRQ